MSYLPIPTLTVSQSSKVESLNAGLALFDEAIKELESVQILSGTGTVQADKSLIVVNGTGARTVTLPDGSSLSAGRLLWIKDGGSAGIGSEITIDGHSSQTIDGLTDATISVPRGVLALFWNGTEWKLLNLQKKVLSSGLFGVISSPSLPLDYDVQLFLGAGTGTWNKPAAKHAGLTIVVLIGAGGGGGSGRRGTATAIGGGGGGGGQVGIFIVSTSSLGATESVSVGAGGTGGAARTADNTSGSNGTAGGNTWFISSSGLVVRGGATGAGGGQGTAVTGALSGSVDRRGGNNVSTGGSGGAGAIGSYDSAGCGGAGGCLDASSAEFQGGGGGGAGGAIGGAGGAARTNGDNGGTSSILSCYERYGGGGGGGGSANGAAGGNGGAGGLYGGAGGGGGASFNGFNSGAGGSGADGMAAIISF